MNIDPNTVFSTGQTLNDFIQLSKIYAHDSTAMNTPDIEAMIPPVLLDPNYVPSNRAPGLIAAHILPLLFALTCVCLRVYAKIKRFGRNGLVIEDYLIMIASVVMCVLAGMAVYGAVHLQQGFKVTDLTAHSLEMSMKVRYPLPSIQHYILIVENLNTRQVINNIKIDCHRSYGTEQHSYTP